MEALFNDRHAEQGEFYKRLRGLVLPIAFQQFMLAAVSASDALMLGRLEQNAMSAVSLAGQVQFVFNLYLAAMTIGATIFAAQYWGKGDTDAVERVFALTFRAAFPVGVLFTLAALTAPSALMRLLTSEPALIEYGAVYLRAAAPSYLFCGASQIYLCIMKNCGRASQSSLIGSACVVLNIVLNAILIFGLWELPKLGVLGAAVATDIARAVELLLVVLFSLPASHVKLRPQYLFRIGKTLRHDFWSYTTPVLANELVWGVGFTMGTVVMGHLGSDAAAASSVASITKNLLVCFCNGIGSGGGIVVGNELGAGNMERARSYGGRICRLSILSGALAGLALLLLRPHILRFVILTPKAAEYLNGMLLICTYYVVGKSVNGAVIGGIFCAGGDSRFGFLCDLITLWGAVVPLSILAAFVWRLPVLAVYVIISMDEIVKLPAVYRHYKKYKWIKNLTREELL